MSQRGLDVIPAGPDRLDDVLLVLDTPCACQYWRMSAGDYAAASVEQRQAALRQQLADTPPAGMLAYLDGKPVGWCGFAVRDRAERLRRSRTIPAVDDVPVWAIYCFTVRVGYRRQGVAHALLAAVIKYARSLDAAALEAYPVESRSTTIHATAAYVGTTRMFEAAGFRRILKTDARSDHRPRWLMRLDLRGGSRKKPESI